MSNVFMFFFTLIDSASTGNFILSALIKTTFIPVEELASSVSVKALDGHPVSSTTVTHSEINLPLWLTLKCYNYKSYCKISLL